VRAEKPEDTTWIEPLVATAKDLRKITIATFTPEQRMIAGRYHAYRYGNCSKNEARNKKFGARMATAFAKMSISALSRLTFAEYVAYANKYHEMSGGSPWYEPFLIQGVMESVPRASGRVDETVRYSSDLSALR
jgi:hypothetical protein